MAVFTYVAKDESGSSFSGTYTEVESVRALRDELEKMGYVLVRARRGRKVARVRGRIAHGEIATFAYKFAGMYAAGLPILRCLSTLEQQTQNRAFRQVISEVRAYVGTGCSLREAFGRHREVFSDFFLGMIEAGEVGGKLDETLEMSAQYLEKQAELRHRVKSAFAYPVIVSVLCLGVIGFLLVYVIPVFSKLYAQVHADLPWPTLSLVLMSELLRRWWWAVIIGGGAAVLGCKRILKEPQVKAWWDRFKLRMPVFGRLNRMLVVSHFARTFGMLSTVGVSVMKSLDMAAVVADNSEMSRVTEELKQSVQSGCSVTEAMREHEVFPTLITELASSGEEVGALAAMLNKGSDLLDRDVERMITSLMVKLEPLLTLTMGLLVGFVLMGAYLPMFDYMGHLR